MPRSLSPSSKDGSAFSKILIGAAVIFAIFRTLPFLALWPATAATVFGQAPNEIPSRVIKIVEFVDRNRTYTVNLDTGRVTFSDFGPAPQPEPQPVEPGLTGFADEVYRAFMAANIRDRKQVAEDLHHQIDVTLAKAGGLGLDAQAIVADLADGIVRAGLDTRLTGFRMGDMLKGQGGDRESILQALRSVQQALRGVK